MNKEKKKCSRGEIFFFRIELSLGKNVINKKNLFSQENICMRVSRPSAKAAVRELSELLLIFFNKSWQRRFLLSANEPPSQPVFTRIFANLITKLVRVRDLNIIYKILRVISIFSFMHFLSYFFFCFCFFFFSFLEAIFFGIKPCYPWWEV